jgi:hypothetical protein
VAEQETAFGSGWIWTMRALGRVARTLREGGRGQDPSVEDVVLGGMVGSWLAGLTATALLYEYVTTSRRFPFPFAHERAEPAKTSTRCQAHPPADALGSVRPDDDGPLRALALTSGPCRALYRAPLRCPHLQRHACPRHRWSLVAQGKGGARRARDGGVCSVDGGQADGHSQCRVPHPDNHLLTMAPDHRSLPAQVASRLLLAAALTAAVAAPFIYAQVGFYRQFCLDRVNPGVTPPAWCAGRLPLLYTHVQRTYWYAVPANLIWTSPLCLSKLTGTL